MRLWKDWEQGQHWELGRLLRIFRSAPWEEFLPQCWCAGADGSSAQLGSGVWAAARSWTLAGAKRELKPWFGCSQRGRQRGWVAVGSKLCVKRLPQCAPSLLPCPLQQRWWAAAQLLVCSWDRAALHCLLFRTELWCPAALSHSDSLAGICFLNNECHSLTFPMLFIIFAEVV